MALRIKSLSIKIKIKKPQLSSRPENAIFHSSAGRRITNMLFDIHRGFEHSTVLVKRGSEHIYSIRQIENGVEKYTSGIDDVRYKLLKEAGVQEIRVLPLASKNDVRKALRILFTEDTKTAIKIIREMGLGSVEIVPVSKLHKKS